MHRVVLFTRSGCHLCDLAREGVDAVRATHPFELTIVDIDERDELIRDYGYRVPVVEVDGEAAFEIEVDRAALSAMVRAPAPSVG